MKVTYEQNRLSNINLSNAYEKVAEITSKKLRIIELNSTDKIKNRKKVGGSSK